MGLLAERNPFFLQSRSFKPRPMLANQLIWHESESSNGCEDCRPFCSQEFSIVLGNRPKMSLPLGGAPVTGPRQRKIRLSGSGQFGFGRQQRRSGGAVEVGTATRGQQLQDVAILLLTLPGVFRRTRFPSATPARAKATSHTRREGVGRTPPIRARVLFLQKFSRGKVTVVQGPNGVGPRGVCAPCTLLLLTLPPA